MYIKSVVSICLRLSRNPECRVLYLNRDCMHRDYVLAVHATGVVKANGSSQRRTYVQHRRRAEPRSMLISVRRDASWVRDIARDGQCTFHILVLPPSRYVRIGICARHYIDIVGYKLRRRRGGGGSVACRRGGSAMRRCRWDRWFTKPFFLRRLDLRSYACLYMRDCVGCVRVRARTATREGIALNIVAHTLPRVFNTLIAFFKDDFVYQ